MRENSVYDLESSQLRIPLNMTDVHTAASLEELIGPEAKRLSASTVARLKRTWAEDYKTWYQQPLNQDRWVYIWADGVYSGLRAEDA